MVERRRSAVVLLSILFAFAAVSAFAQTDKQLGVKYDSRSLIVNGNRNLFFSGSIHYPRAPPEMWLDLIQKAKDGGLNTIETYVFWNIHEPVQGQWNFEGNYDFVKFVKLIGEQGLHVILRIGPYIEAEWNMGGFPFWLREVPNITFRSYNEPFMFHMKRYAEKIVNMAKSANLFADQGGPIILAQIENEYNNVQLAYKESGKKYVEWAASMANSLYSGVPWAMCKQKEAPPSIIITCNGRHCGETFIGPGPNKPSLWTENWTAQYRTFGDPPSQRSAEEIAFAVAQFFARNGTLTNYYMYYGGTNYGRTASSFVATRYYDEAPLDEFGLKREPKFGHLRDLHRALRLAKKALLRGTRREQRINQFQEIVTYEKDSSTCATFLINNHAKLPAVINYKGKDYNLPMRSISILPDCKTLVFNTFDIVSQHNSRNMIASKKVNAFKWEYFQESIPRRKEMSIKNKLPLELYTLTKDASDYAWYSTRIIVDRHDLPRRPDVLPVLQVASLGHALLAFVNGEYIGYEHGNNIEKSFVFQKPISLKPGVNEITLLAMTVGFPNSGAYMEKRFAGPKAITIQGLNTGTLDITLNYWSHEVGINGEKKQLYTEEGSQSEKWQELSVGGNGAGLNTPVTWYKAYFDEPEGKSPIAITMNKMAKGMIWINGKSIGRYWSSFLSPLAKPTQSEYHIPRAFLKPKGNLVVIFEETGGDPRDIKLMMVNRDTICSYIHESNAPSVRSWERKGNVMRPIMEHVTPAAHLSCPENKVVKAVEFASFGNPYGDCGSFVHGNCTVPDTVQFVEKSCLGKNECSVPLEKATLLGQNIDGCPDTDKTLAVQLKCGFENED